MDQSDGLIDLRPMKLLIHKRPLQVHEVLPFLAVLASMACVSYRPAPLPPGEDAAPTPELTRLAVKTAELEHPTLPPLTVDLDDGLSPDEAAVLAVLANPGLAALRLTHNETAAQLVAAGMLPAPLLSYGRDHPYGSGATGTVDATNLALELDLSALTDRSARVAQAEATLAKVDLGIAWQEWQVAQAARLAAVRSGLLARRIVLVDGELSAEERTLDALRAALEEGDATVSDVGVQLARVEALRRFRNELRRDEVEARGELAQLLGLGDATDLRIVPTVGAAHAGDMVPDDLVASAVNDRLDLLALRRGYEAQEAGVRQAVLAQLPSLSVGIAHQRDEASLKFLGGYVTLGLTLPGQARAAIRREEATRARLGRELAARTAALGAEIRTLLRVLTELETQLENANAAVDRLAPLAATQREAAVLGDVDRLSEQVVRAALADAQLHRAALEQARAETLVGLATAIGQPLDQLVTSKECDCAR